MRPHSPFRARALTTLGVLSCATAVLASPTAVPAAGALVEYLQETQKTACG